MFNFQMYVVAGGSYANDEKSTETLSSLGTSWILEMENPLILNGAAGVSLNNEIFLFGKYSN